MDKQTRVTVLVYVHDAEEYLTDCLKSLSNQILDDMEIVCINDGSSDGSKDILDNFAKKESRMRVISLKKSAGYGRVLNRGIKMANGEYVGIIEATDFINPEMFIELFALAKKHEADVARGSYTTFENDKDTLNDYILPEETGFIINPMENTRIFYQPPAIWSAIYKKDFLEKQKIAFLETNSCVCQDISFSIKVLASGGNIVLTDKPYLHHRPTITKITDQELFNINREFAEAENYLKNKDVWKTYGFIFEAVKFASFHWYMLNLGKTQLEKFALRMRAEFHDADNKNMLRKPYFPKNHWRMLRVLLDTSDTAFLLIFKSYARKKKLPTVKIIPKV
ncbi:glycosyltransferase [Candidatus Saccharibacteria bacterium]|nr:glycosyltransferase [Candidatus Saccharibacteria bacterium]